MIYPIQRLPQKLERDAPGFRDVAFVSKGGRKVLRKQFRDKAGATPIEKRPGDATAIDIRRQGLQDPTPKGEAAVQE